MKSAIVGRIPRIRRRDVGAHRPLEIFAVLLLAGVSYSLSQTLIVPAIPDIVREFGASETSASWLLTGFLLSASIATPIAGKLGDVLGSGRVLAGVMLIFSAGGTLGALSHSIGPMIAGRGRVGRRLPARLRHREGHLPRRPRRRRVSPSSAS